MEDYRIIIHVSYQDPYHLMGGQGVAVLNLCLAQINLGYKVIWISPCAQGEKPGRYRYANGNLLVVKMQTSRSSIPTFYAPDARTQEFREIFGEAFTRFIGEEFDPEDCFINLHGFVEVPRRAKQLIEQGYNVTSTFHMLFSTRLGATGREEPFLPRLRELEGEAIAANTKIIVNSKGMMADLNEICPDWPGKYFVIPNGVEDVFFDTARTPRNRSPLVVSHGRISPEKGFDCLIEAAKRITKRRREKGKPDVFFLIFGKVNNSVEAKKCERELEKLSDGFENIKLDMRPEGIWGEERIRYIDRSWISVMLSRYEPFGLVLPEYMARGKPIVSSLTRGSRNILETSSVGRTPYGWVVDENPDSVADAIEWLVANREEAEKMGDNCQRRARQEYVWPQIAQRIEGVYKTTPATMASEFSDDRSSETAIASRSNKGYRKPENAS